MNHKGQTLVVFVIIVPIFILFLAFVCDTGLIFKEKTRLQSVLKTVLKNTYDEHFSGEFENKVITLLEKNNIPTDRLNITIIDNNITIENEYEINSIFGGIIGIKNYKIKNKITAFETDGKLIIKKE